MSEPASDADGASLEGVVSAAVTTLTLLVGFGLLAADVSYFWVAFPVGFGGLLPLALGVTRLYQRRQQTEPDTAPASETDDALASLRQRYARGELSDEAFEHQVERLLETEPGAATRTYSQETEQIDAPGERERSRE